MLLALLILPASAAGAKQRPRHLPFGQWVAFNAGLAGTFDAQGLFNPGKVFPTLSACVEQGHIHVHGAQLPHPHLPRF